MRTFRGGVHPPSNKKATCKVMIKNANVPEELIFPLSQHIGAPAQPCVKVGDCVLKGQKIAEADGFVSANIHSSVSGEVVAIEKRLHPNSTRCESIVIKNDFKDDEVPTLESAGTDYESKSPKELIEIIKEAGIVGMGGATFPTHVKLSVPDNAKIEYVIINGAECEPYLTSDHRAMLETTDEVIGGLLVIMHIFGLKDGYIAVEDNKPDAIAVLKAAAEKIKHKNIHIVTMKTKYPQGAEKQLIYSVTKKKLPAGMLPWQVGCIVNNIDTCASIYRAVVQGKVLTERIVTLCGDGLKNTMNYRVRIGTPFEYMIEQSGGTVGDVGKVIMGGPMMGTAVADVCVPVIKGTSGILVMTKETAEFGEESVCIRCGKCVYACPMKLQPNLLDMAARNKDTEKMIRLNINDCIECGSCAYVCPAKRRQVQQIKVGKMRVRNEQNNK